MNAHIVATKELDTRPTSEPTVGVKNVQRLELRIGGMTCAHCPPAIEKAIAAVAGVIAAQVNPATKIARIDYDPSRTNIASILQAVRAVGSAPPRRDRLLYRRGNFNGTMDQLICDTLRRELDAEIALSPGASSA